MSFMASRISPVAHAFLANGSESSGAMGKQPCPDFLTARLPLKRSVREKHQHGSQFI